MEIVIQATSCSVTAMSPTRFIKHVFKKGELERCCFTSSTYLVKLVAPDKIWGQIGETTLKRKGRNQKSEGVILL
jgi:hypothetical protein